MNWVIGGVGFIMWLYGPAGAGKSAIAQTIAELCFAQKRLLASFFFSRSDPNRNHERSLIATLSYQIALNIPQAKPLIEQVVDDDPSIFQRSLETQCTSLVIEPILELFNSGLITGPFPYVVIIDGLDECRDSKVQRYILDIIASSLKEHYIPIMFLISSRPEPPISIAFNSLMLNDTTMRLALDDSFFPDADIECFLRDSFEEIRRNHPMNAFIPMTWPNNWDIQVLVEKSSGQFIYAATVIRYVSSFRHRPTDRLEVILGIRPPRNDTPFAELDYLYKNIFSSVEDTDAALRVLGVLLLPRNVPWDPEIPLSPLFHAINIRMPDALERFMFLNPGDIQQILIDLGSVVSFENQNTEIRVLHASLGDFLFDPLRSNEYYVEPASVHSTLAHLCLRHIEIHGTTLY
jgi:hypothetical protein